jgi:hypothetical protein
MLRIHVNISITSVLIGAINAMGETITQVWLYRSCYVSALYVLPAPLRLGKPTFLSTECIYEFRMIDRVNIDYFPDHLLCLMETHFGGESFSSE